MIDFLNSFKSLIKLEKIHTDNNVFKLHYKFTVIILIIFSILLTSKQYFGDPIDCESQHTKAKTVINSYCWIYGTYIFKSSLKEKYMPGLGNVVSDIKQPDIFNRHGPNEEILSQKYYQWVCIVFIFQALLFYIPRYLWKTWEGGRLRILVKDLVGPVIVPGWDHESKDRLVRYITSKTYNHNIYALRYFFCEILNFTNVLLQILLMDWFLTEKFTGYGIGVATLRGYQNPMHAVFPKMTKCTYYNYGPSGSIQSIDAMCILPLNVVNEKLFLFLWFWFVFLTVMSFLELIYRILILLVPVVRVYILIAQTQFVSHKTAYVVVRHLSYGDFFVLNLLGKNLNPLIFKDFVLAIEAALNVQYKDMVMNPGFKQEMTLTV